MPRCSVTDPRPFHPDPQGEATPLPHATQRLPAWKRGWRESGRLVLLLDFDGTLAPIVDRPERAALPERAREVIERLVRSPGMEVAVVSGRGLTDARERVGIAEIAYAGNHGMEIQGPRMHRLHAEAAAARPLLERIVRELTPRLAETPGAILEDKGLTLSVHYRLTDERGEERVRRWVSDAVAHTPELRLTEGKKVLEVRPRVEWDKGRAVLFLLEQLAPPRGAPVVYIGDDTTDEDAFRALNARDGWGEGVLVAAPLPPVTAAQSYLNDPTEVAALLAELAEA